ncbi:MAG: CDGSH iron-sulfur domain-containing protein [Flavobacteriales bacterium]|nr:CDGSH iron-sulfur domain-containing protein [Flavobacteriales bacterium]
MMKPGKYAWCSCGKSASQPLCDAAHNGTSFSAVVFEITHERTVRLCGCKQPSAPPYCDNSHLNL